MGSSLPPEIPRTLLATEPEHPRGTWRPGHVLLVLSEPLTNPGLGDVEVRAGIDQELDLVLSELAVAERDLDQLLEQLEALGVGSAYPGPAPERLRAQA